MGSPDYLHITIPVQRPNAAIALEVVSKLIEDERGRQAYKDGPADAFRRKQEELEEPSLRNASYDDIPPNSRAALESLSVEQLEALAALNRTFVADGLYVQVPSPGRLFYH